MDNKDGRRLFTRNEKIAMANAADWRSDLSGEPLGDDYQADHIIPHSIGGPTSILNGQVLTPAENLKKSNKVLPKFSYESLREWQRRCVDTFRRKEGVDFMLAALPGSGKTIASLYCAKEFLDGGANRKIIIVVPTDHLREQWRNEAYKVFGLNLQTKDFRGTLRNATDGVITTYQAVAASPVNFLALANRHDIMLIADEIHHLADVETAKWTWAFRHAFSGPRIKKRLSTSGTPIRTKGERIPFLTVKEGGNEYHLDVRYDYPAAIMDKIIRRVTFSRYRGRVDLMDADGKQFSLDTSDELAENLINLRLSRLLTTEEYAKGLLAEADIKLSTVRQKKPTAGALALCIDSDHAQRVARWLKEITGESPDVVVNNDDVATSSINEYRESGRRWIVAVRMVSEGVDIKRLMVLAYLTTIHTDLFFRQAVGRIVRHDGTKNDRHAYCFIPSDPRLHTYASTIEEFQALVPEEQDDPKPRKSKQPGDPVAIMTVGASSPEFEGMVVAGESFDADTSTLILDVAQAANITPDESAIAWAMFTDQMEKGEAPSSRFEDKHPEEELKEISKKCKARTVALAYEMRLITDKTSQESKRLALKNLTNWVADKSGTPIAAKCSLEQMRAKHAWILMEIQKHRRSH